MLNYAVDPLKTNYPFATRYFRLSHCPNKTNVHYLHCVTIVDRHEVATTEANHSRLQTDSPISHRFVTHLGFEVSDADAAEEAAGIPVKMKGRRANRTGFTYYDTAEGGGVVLLTRATNKPGT